MGCRKKISLGIFIAFITIQFIQPVRNKSGQVLPTDMSKTVNLPGNVQGIFKNACYDCHSNNTNYPWYSYIQPVGWLLHQDIKEGKENLNFSTFGAYSPRRQRSKLREIETSIKEGSMPLSSYTFIHSKAQLTKEDRAAVLTWIQATIDSLAIQ
jgi:hypothetical protein